MLHNKILLEGLKELSSQEFQRDYWLLGDEKRMSSFEEAICMVFDDARLTRAVDSGYLASNFSDEICRKVDRLNRLISLVPHDVSPEELIKHPRMEEIRAISGELYSLMEEQFEISP